MRIIGSFQADSNLFVFVFASLVFANAVLLACVFHGMTKRWGEALELGGEVLSMCFIVELAIKLVGLGPRLYVKEPFNVLDGIIVAATSIELIGGAEFVEKAGITKTMKLLRVLRLLKLIHYITPFRVMVAAMLRSLKALIWIVALIGIFICIFASMGMQLFGGRFLDLPLSFHCLSLTFHCLFTAFHLPFIVFSLLFLDLPLSFHCLCLAFHCLFTVLGGRFDFPDGRPRHNFDSFGQAFLTVWQVITLYNWELVCDQRFVKQANTCPRDLFL